MASVREPAGARRAALKDPISNLTGCASLLLFRFVMVNSLSMYGERLRMGCHEMKLRD
jgi:hypothetical protein